MDDRDLIALARARVADTPWPELERELSERGATPEQLAAVVDALFPPRPKAHWKSGLVGAVVGMALWAVGAWLYRR